MALSWSGRRQLLYTTVGSVVLVLLLLYAYVEFFTATPTCFDGKWNGDEKGIDCGGSCALFCAADTRAPVVLWARAFEVAPNTYTAAAYVQNPNPLAAARNVAYSFQLFDDKNLLVTERVGTINIPPLQTVPFIDPNINVGNRTVSKAIFSFSANPVWTKIGTLPALRATIVNDSIEDAVKVTIAAVLFDTSGTARAASRSLLATVPRKGSVPVVFTWSGGVQNIVRAEITILPSF